MAAYWPFPERQHPHRHVREQTCKFCKVDVLKTSGLGIEIHAERFSQIIWHGPAWIVTVC